MDLSEPNGDGTTSGARSVSAKKPPSMWGSRLSALTTSWICGDESDSVEGLKLGFRV